MHDKCLQIKSEFIEEKCQYTLTLKKMNIEKKLKNLWIVKILAIF